MKSNFQININEKKIYFEGSFLISPRAILATFGGKERRLSLGVHNSRDTFIVNFDDGKNK